MLGPFMLLLPCFFWNPLLWVHSPERLRSGLFKYILAEKLLNQEIPDEKDKDTNQRGVDQRAIAGQELS